MDSMQVIDQQQTMDAQARKVKIVAAAHSFTDEMNALGVKYAAVIYDETIQEDGEGLKMWSVGNLPVTLQDWLLGTYMELRGNSEIVDAVHVSHDPNLLPA
jgi:hypothetical protein